MKTEPDDLIDSWKNLESSNAGLTKREYFAAMAMQGMLANSAAQDAFNQRPLSYANYVEIADLSVKQADELVLAFLISNLNPLLISPRSLWFSFQIALA